MLIWKGNLSPVLRETQKLLSVGEVEWNTATVSDGRETFFAQLIRALVHRPTEPPPY